MREATPNSKLPSPSRKTGTNSVFDLGMGHISVPDEVILSMKALA